MTGTRWIQRSSCRSRASAGSNGSGSGAPENDLHDVTRFACVSSEPRLWWLAAAECCGGPPPMPRCCCCCCRRPFRTAAAGRRPFRRPCRRPCRRRRRPGRESWPACACQAPFCTDPVRGGSRPGTSWAGALRQPVLLGHVLLRARPLMRSARVWIGPGEAGSLCCPGMSFFTGDPIRRWLMARVSFSVGTLQWTRPLAGPFLRRAGDRARHRPRVHLLGTSGVPGEPWILWVSTRSCGVPGRMWVSARSCGVPMR